MPKLHPARQRPSSTRWAIVAAILVGLALIPRLWAAQDAFWLDEVWSLVYYAEGRTAADIVARTPDSNNHHLMTLWMFCCGPRDRWLVYRLPSLVAGIGTVVLAGWVCRRYGQVPAIVATLLTGSSFALVTYSSEARGYALCGFFALAAFALLKWFLSTRGWTPAVLFAVAVWLGFLSHLTMAIFYAGALVWSLVVIWKSAKDWRQATVTLARCHLLPLAGLALFYWIALGDYALGGAPDYAMSDMVARTLALMLGVYSAGAIVVWSAAILAMGLIVLALETLRRERDDAWIFFAVTTLAAPALVLLTRPAALFERFFYVCMLFDLVLLSILFGRAYERRGWARWGAVTFLTLFTFVNGQQVYRFLKVGRGHYAEAIAYMAENSRGSTIHVASDSNFRNGTLLAYYAPLVLGTRPLVYHSQCAGDEMPVNHLPVARRNIFAADDSPQAIEWILTHGFEAEYRPFDTVTDTHGAKYSLVRTFPYYGLSGGHWALFHRVQDAPARP